MKAEHRKELETNTLADRMGQMMQRVKTGRRSTFMIYLLVGVALVIGAWFFYVTMISNKQEASERWVRLDDGSQKNLFDLMTKEPESPAGKSARLQIAWFVYWEYGVKRLGAEKTPAKALLAIDEAGDIYAKLAKDCADDAIFEPQALLGIAVVNETKALHDKLFLEKAVDAYKEVVKKYGDKGTVAEKTAEGKYAQSRLDKLSDKTSREEIERLYTELRGELGVKAALDMPGLPKDHPKFDIPLKK